MRRPPLGSVDNACSQQVSDSEPQRLPATLSPRLPMSPLLSGRRLPGTSAAELTLCGEEGGSPGSQRGGDCDTGELLDGGE